MKQELSFSPDALWSLQPDTFAVHASNGKWKPYPWLEFLSDRIAPKLVEGGGRFLVTAPPQHGKSEFLSNWTPTWFLHTFQQRRVILTSYASSYADKWGSKVRENLTTNPWCSIPMRFDTKSKKRFMTSEGGGMITAGIGGPVTGEGADLLIIDDPFKNYAEAVSPIIRQRNSEWYRSVARTRLQPGASVIIMHTRWHEDDLIGELMQEPGWDLINLPAFSEGDGDVLGRPKGRALCPERYNELALASLREDLGPMLWDALFQQSPVSLGGNVVKGDWIRYYDQLPENLDEMGIWADLAYKDGEQNDFSVFEVWGRKGTNCYLIDQLRGHYSFPEQIDALLKMIETYPKAFHREIEEKANGAALIQMVKDKVPGLIANNPKTSKEARLATVSPLYRAGNVNYPNPDKYPWVKENVKELTKFPKTDHDDTVDVASMALMHLGQMTSAISRLDALSKW